MFFWGGKGIATGDLGHHYGCLSQVAYEYPRNNKTFTQTLCNCQYYDIHFLLELEMKPFKLGQDTSYILTIYLFDLSFLVVYSIFFYFPNITF